MLLKKFITTFLPFISIAILFASCDDFNTNNKKVIGSDEIINADMAFSNMSRQVGMKKAFIEYMSNDGVLLRPDHLPIIGADAIDFLSQVNDTAYTLSWKPLKGEISKSGDFGYTYGVYELTATDTVIKGTYVNIWKKQSDGAWKFILDSGNQGTTPNQP
jgi:ketosteroid isomerase-like protein